MRRRHKILVVVDEPAGDNPPEAVVRAVRLALGLATEHSIVFCSTVGSPVNLPGLTSTTLSGRRLWLHAELASLIIATRTSAARLPYTRTGRMCVDLGSFSPLDFTAATCPSVTPGKRLGEYLRLTNAALRSGDFFLCPSDADRTNWLGALAAAGRIRAKLYDADPKLRRLLDVAPLEALPHLDKPVSDLPDSVRRYCASPWRNPRPGR